MQGLGVDLSGLIESFFGAASKVSSFIAEQTADNIAKPLLKVINYTPTPKRCATEAINTTSACASENLKPAIFREPAIDNIYHSAYELYWNDFLQATLVLGLLLYMLVAAADTVPGANVSRQKKLLSGGLFKLVLYLIGLWPVMMATTYLMAVLNTVASPAAGELVQPIGDVLAAVAAATVSPFAIVTGILGLIDVFLFVTAIALYLGRIAFLPAVPAAAPLLLMFYVLDVPFLKGLSKKLFSAWVKIGIAPALAGVFLSVCAEFISVLQAGNGPIAVAQTTNNSTAGQTTAQVAQAGASSIAGEIAGMAIALLMPVGTIAALYISFQSTLPGVGKPIRAAQRQVGYTQTKDAVPDAAKQKLSETDQKVRSEASSAVSSAASAVGVQGGLSSARSSFSEAADSALSAGRRGSQTSFSKRGFKQRLEVLEEYDSDDALGSGTMQEAIEMVDDVPGNDVEGELNRLEQIRRASGASPYEVIEEAERFSEGLRYNSDDRGAFYDGSFDTNVPRDNPPGKEIDADDIVDVDNSAVEETNRAGEELDPSDIVDASGAETGEEFDLSDIDGISGAETGEELDPSDIVNASSTETGEELDPSDIVDANSTETGEGLDSSEATDTNGSGVGKNLNTSDIIDEGDSREQSSPGNTSGSEFDDGGAGQDPQRTAAADYMEKSQADTILGDHDLSDPEVFDAYSSSSVGSGVGSLPDDWEQSTASESSK